MATFVTSQMHFSREVLASLSDRIGTKVSFMPNLLFRSGFETRVNMYLRTANARRRADDTALDSRTRLRRFVRLMEESEEEVARYFVAGCLSGNRVSWEAAVKLIKPDVTWLAVDLARRGTIGDVDNKVHQIEQKYGALNVVTVKSLAELRAAVSIAESYQPGLADRIGCGDRFVWQPFALLLRRLFGKRSRRHVTAPSVPGVFWR